MNTSLVGLEETYKETEELINNKDKKNIERQEKEIDSKVEEYNKKQEELAITSSNLQSKVGEHLKWFSAAYLGPYIKSENARLVSYSNGEGKVQLDVFDGLSGEKEKTITVTFRYKDGKYIITNYS